MRDHSSRHKTQRATRFRTKSSFLASVRRKTFKTKVSNPRPGCEKLVQNDNKKFGCKS